jgi:hypothetical protein
MATDLPLDGGAPRVEKTPRADRWFGLFWMLLGGAIVYGSWTMDRMEAQQVNPYTLPGIYTGAVGIVIALFGMILLIRAQRQLARADAPPRWRLDPHDFGRTALALFLCVGFAVGLVGRGPPFWLAVFVFLFVTIFLFQLPERRARGQLARGALVAAACAAGTAVIVTLVFQELFLVRLP